MADGERGPDGLLKEMAARARSELDELLSVRVRVGFIGQSGSGKSSLMNALVGRAVAAVGHNEQTMDPMEVEHEGLILVDLPGCGTPRWPQATYIQNLELATKYDAFVITTHERVFESDVFLYRELHGRHHKPVFVVRTKIDRAVDDGRFDNGISEEQVLASAGERLISALAPRPVRVFLVSSRAPTRWDLPDLQEALVGSQHGMKREKARLSFRAWSQAALVEKRAACMKLASRYAALAAANSINPIPGLDVSVDLGILTTMSVHVIRAYGLTDEQLRYAEAVLGRSLGIRVAQRVSELLTVEGIKTVLRKWLPRVATREFSKWIPFIGTLISAVVGYKLTLSYAEELVDRCDNAARELIGTIGEHPLLAAEQG